MDDALAWSESVLGPIVVLSDHSKEHGDHESATCRLRTSLGACYLKVHETASHWNNEVHAYEHWATAFGNHAPHLLAVHDQPPYALVISELPGKIVEDLPLPISVERNVWRTAGAALVELHKLGTGEFFGPCLRDGTCVGKTFRDPLEYVEHNIDAWLERAIKSGILGEQEIGTVRSACKLIPAFAGERPRPCHRDFCTANWLVDEDGTWCGIVDFEFAYWDVRVADFSRDPSWAWLRRPDLVQAFFDGYGFRPTLEEQQQLLVAHTEYALGAIVWGHENAFYGFEEEGRQALARLSQCLHTG